MYTPGPGFSGASWLAPTPGGAGFAEATAVPFFAAVLPARAVGLQGGYGAPEPTADQLHKLALTARTRSDHLALREYYSMVAKRKASEADILANAAAAYRAGARRGTYDGALAIEQRVRAARKAATQATEAANRHAVLANVA